MPQAVLVSAARSPIRRWSRDRSRACAPTYPRERLGEPREIASSVAFLPYDHASWTTGQMLAVDGGVTLAGPAERPLKENS